MKTIAYQLGWMKPMLSWDRDELQGRKPVLPAPGYKWNLLGPLYRSFYDMYRHESMLQLRETFITAVGELTEWIRSFSDDELFLPGGRK